MEQIVKYKTFDNMTFDTEDEAKRYEFKVRSAIATISELCQRHRRCGECPFSGDDAECECKLKNYIPERWKEELI